MADQLTNLIKYITDGAPEDIIKRYAALPQKARESDFGEYDTNIVVIDTETTGVSLKKDELTQIAAARLEKGEITSWYVTFVNPGKPIPGEIAHLTNIHDEDVADAPTPEEALLGLVEFAGDAKMVAHNAEFDRNFITKHPAGFPLTQNTWIDTLELARIGLPRMKAHRLIDLVKAFDAPLSTHRADEDVAATCALYRILLAAIDSIPKSLLREISLLAPVEEWPQSELFAYFANRETSKKSSQESFSLRTIRAQRAKERPRKAKRDAATLIPESLLEDSNVRIETSSGEVLPTMKFPSPDDVEEAFSPDGIVGSLYPDFETREEQLEMALAVRNSFEESVNLMIEAGTGVGKSMAYLVPAAMCAIENGITIGVATKTNALLDQLVYKELPKLSESFNNELTFAPLKGFSHYLCLRKVENLVLEGAKMREVANVKKTQAPAIATVLSFIEQTAFDDIDTLKIDFRLLPKRAITTTSHDCLRRKCPFYGEQCFVHGSRRMAEDADILVTNQSLLFCDVAADGGLLPNVRYWIVDEAHGAESEARRALSLDISVEDLNKLVARVSEGSDTKNVFTRAESAVSSKSKDPESALTLFFALTAKARKAGIDFADAEREFALHVPDLLYFDPQKKSSYDVVDIWMNDEVQRSEIFKKLQELNQSMTDRAEKLINSCQELVGYLEDIEGVAYIQREIASIALELKDLVNASVVIFKEGSDRYVYSASLSKRKDRGSNTLSAQLYNVGSTLDETLYAQTRSIVFASATLTVDNSFEAFENAMGLNTSSQSRANELQLNSSFDFDKNMAIYIVSDIPEPKNPQYLKELTRMLIGFHSAQHGSMLTLFTNKSEMETCFSEVASALKQEDLRVVCQRWGVSVKGLRDEFIADETLSLFALKSFWEGFDAPGSTLKGVIIPKLPFQKPTNPLSCERSTRDDAAWRHYVLPQAVLEIKQAAGRLIRKANDTGVLILADSRLVSKGYRQVFINSLPSNNVQTLTFDEITAELEQKHNERTMKTNIAGESSISEESSTAEQTSPADSTSSSTAS